MDYDFSRLSTRSFEQLVQAIALESIGPGVSIFGDGPDGAREATFEGTVSFPSVSKPWNGYGVVQAKFRQKPGIRDGDWAFKELKDELDKFLDDDRCLKKPEYYIFATNVILTPVADTGGKDRVTKLINSYKGKIGIKDFRIWDRDQLNCFIDIHKNIRTSYAAWVTSGDVLTAVINSMGLVRQDFKSVMLNFVSKELISEQYVNLGQAGSSTDDKIPLACVFVDVPISGSSIPSPTDRIALSSKNDMVNEFDSDYKNENFSAIKNLLYISSQRLDQKSNYDKNKQGYLSQIPGRVVFIGGPGQGKSTLTQFFCQMHRAALLSQHSSQIMTPEVTNAYKLIVEQCDIERISPPQLPRFPLKVDLNRFASALAKRETSSLLNYVLEIIKRRCDREIDSNDLRSWLKAYPWLLALDGLDEVPASSNRIEVLEKIDDFLIDAHECNADLMIVATSRPQGYNDDFTEKYYCHLNLSPLTSTNALHYAKRLITRRWGADHDKVTQFLQRIGRASEEESTVRLMKSPLQVTIMALLVESLGEPPKERWRLFNEYYQVINRREKERDIPAAKLLNTYQSDIDVIHQEVGKISQLKSEVSGSTDALLSVEQFSSIIDYRLKSEGHSDNERHRLKQDILSAALERLVFLVAPQEGRVGFEIRSLQEFMAAQALMNGADGDVITRLKCIAHASHWRNVFLFAAGRCFYERQHLRAEILSLCMALNENIGSVDIGILPSKVLAGSQLAIDILEDGAITNQPAQKRFFLRLAMRVIELPPNESHIRLSALYSTDVQDVYKEHLLHILQDSSLLMFYGAWHVVLILVSNEVPWACDEAEKLWPKDPLTAFKIISSLRELPASEFLLNRACSVFLENSPEKSSRFELIKIKRLANNLNIKDLGCVSYLTSIDSHESDRINVLINGVSNKFRLTLAAGGFDKNAISNIENMHPLWGWLFKVFNFNRSSTNIEISNLFSELDLISSNFTPQTLGDWVRFVPWPVAACINELNDNRDLKFYAQQMKSGALGSGESWEAAKERWVERGVDLADFNYCALDDLPFDTSIGKVGFPTNCAGAMIMSTKDKVSANIFDVLKGIKILKVKSEMAKRYLFSLSCEGAHELDLGSCELEELPNTLSLIQEELVHVSFLNALPTKYLESPGFLSVIRFLEGKRFVNGAKLDAGLGSKIELLLSSNKHNAGMLNLFYLCCLHGFRPTTLSDWVNTENFESVVCKGYAAIIRLAKGSVKMTMIDEISLDILNAEDYSVSLRPRSFIVSALNFIGPGSLNEKISADLLSNLQSSLDVCNLRLKSMVFEKMQELQRSHLSLSFGND
ncbi:hypothetical protein WKH71_11820 [Pantoea agglomerans]|uniref:NACHT domain-containing protein n=1 Tax=Enterobacter agglomerans TaxID=549 RepID=UPI003C7B85F8